MTIVSGRGRYGPTCAGPACHGKKGESQSNPIRVGRRGTGKAASSPFLSPDPYLSLFSAQLRGAERTDGVSGDNVLFCGGRIAEPQKRISAGILRAHTVSNNGVNDNTYVRL